MAAAGSDRIISGGYDGAVASTSATSGRTSLFGYHDHLVNAVVADPSGKWVASCSSDHTVALWDATTGEQVWRRSDHTDDVEAFAFLPGGLGASASRDHRIVLRDLRSGEPVRVLRGHEQDVLGLAAADILISAGDDRTMRAWDPETGELLCTWGPFSHESDTCAIDPVRRIAALGTEDGTIRVMSLADGEVAAEVRAHSSAVKSLDVAPSGRLLSAGYDQTIQLRDVGRNLDPVVRLDAPAGMWERSIRWGHGVGDLLAGTFDGTVLHWPATSDQPREIGGDGLGNVCINDVAAGPGHLGAVADDGVVRLLDRCPEGTLRLVASGVPATRVLMNAVAVHGAGVAVLAGGHDGRIGRWVRRNRSLVQQRSVDLGSGPVNSIAPTVSGGAVVATYGGELFVLDGNLRVMRRHRLHGGPVKAVRIHPNGRLVASGSADGSVVLWELATGRPVQTIRASGKIVNDLAFSPDGSTLSVIGRDLHLTVHHLLDGRAERMIPLGQRSLKSVVHLSANRILVGDYWGGVAAVDLESGAVEHHEVARNGVSSLALLDGVALAASYDGSLSELTAQGSTTAVTRLMDQRPARLVSAAAGAAAIRPYS